MLNALRTRDFRTIWLAESFSLVGNWVQITVQSWAVVKATDSPMALGALNIAYFLPTALVSLFGGAIADRFARRKTLVATQVISALLATVLGLLVVRDRLHVGALYVVAALRGTVLAFELPARRRLIMDVVGTESLQNAMGLSSISFNLARVTGPAIGGLLVANAGPAAAFFFNAVSFVPCAVAYSSVAKAVTAPATDVARASMLTDIREGLAHVLRSPRISMALGLIFVVGVFCNNFGVTLPLVAEHVLKVGPERFGLLFSCMGAGALVGGIAISQAKKASMAYAFGAACLVTGCVAAVGWSRSFALTGGFLAVAGLSIVIFGVSASALVTILTPNELRGRVSGIEFTIQFLGAPLGAFIASASFELLGARGLYALAGMALTGILVAYLVGAITRRAPSGA